MIALLATAACGWVSLAPDTVNMSFLVDRDNLFPSVDALFSCFFCECSHTATRVWQHSIIYKYFIYILNMWCCITLAQLKPRSSSEKLKFRIQTEQGGTDICHMTKNVSVPYCGSLLRCAQRRFSTGFNVFLRLKKKIFVWSALNQLKSAQIQFHDHSELVCVFQVHANFWNTERQPSPLTMHDA